jgi:DNA (cytosine-5)-methyltransferase 1
MTFCEFFCGGGMARAGLGAGREYLFANDSDPKKAAAYTANSTADRLVIGDVASLAALPGAADLAWASPPCQDLSLAGDRAGLGGTRSSAFWPFWKLMQRAAPRMIVIENVCGLLTSHGGRDFGAVMIDAALSSHSRESAHSSPQVHLIPPASAARLGLGVIRRMSSARSISLRANACAAAVTTSRGAILRLACGLWLMP